jgi:hypothetical protein
VYVLYILLFTRYNLYLVVDVDVMLRAPGLKGLLSVTDDDAGTKESGSVQPQPVTASQAVNWDW